MELGAAVMICLCKSCDVVDITCMDDLRKWEAVYLCRCCGGLRYEYRRVCSNGQRQGR